LKKNRTDVKNAYSRDLSRFGRGFATGDAEAHSSLSAILFRLNAGFVSVIERFTRGRSTPTDYQALVNLSNASRLEAIGTFEQLSKRLSRSSLASPHIGKLPEQGSRRGQKRKASKQPVGHIKHVRSKSVPGVSLTPLGPANSEGWVRPKPGRKLSSDSKSSGSSSANRSSPKGHNTQDSIRKSSNHSQVTVTRTPPTRLRPEIRKSIMSFASDSTKLGEIPEHKWTRPSMFEAGTPNFPVTTLYPLESYQEPPKQRSRLMRLFRR